MTKIDSYRHGVIAVAASSVFNSSAGLIVRQVEDANEWQIIAWRGIGEIVGLSLIFCIQEHGRLLDACRQLSTWLLLGALFQSVASICFIHALQNTTIANALFVLSAAPLTTAVLARIFLNERVSRATWAAMFVALIGIVVMVGDGVVSGTGFGNLMALGAMICFSAFVVVLRRGRAVNMLPGVILSWVVSLGAGVGMTSGDLSIPLRDILFVLLWGVVVSSVMYCLLTYGSRHVPGAEVTLLVQLEFVLGPLWVWLFVGEVPNRLTLLGGLIVLGAVVVRGISMARQNPRQKTGTD